MAAMVDESFLGYSARGVNFVAEVEGPRLLVDHRGDHANGSDLLGVG
jgi:hypothetical protein